VLGGLIKENKTVTQTKVPFFGDIPFFGQIFKSQTNNKQRNELIIFIRPTVMRTDDQAVAEAHRRAALLRAGEELELEKRFSRNPTNAPRTELRGSPPRMSEPPKATRAPAPKASTATDAYSAKVRALEQQPLTAE
jgi:general secretion pathway protein D